MTSDGSLLVDTYDVALLDLDGVVYVGDQAVPYAEKTLARVREIGMGIGFVTNNAARTPNAVAQHLSGLGIAANPAEVVTSAQAAARLLVEMVPDGSAVLVVGGDGLIAALEEVGLRPVTSADDQPAAVVQGFHPDLDWRRLAEGAYALERGVPWVASNTDPTLPTPRGRAPGNGTFVDVLRQVSGRKPVVAGKPEPPVHREAAERTKARHPLVVGDRLDTDIEGANRVGTDSLLVLTGVTDPDDLMRASPNRRPTYLGDDLRALLRPSADAVVASGQNRCGAWEAEVAGGRLTLRQLPGVDEVRAIDAIRALCGAAWEAPHVPVDVTDALAEVAALR